MAHLYLDQRKRPQVWRFQYTDSRGLRRTGTGTTSKAETLEMARLAEAHERAKKKGWADEKAPPTSAELAADRAFSEVKDEYLSWGEAQGGRGGRPWSKHHARRRQAILDWWETQLGLKVLRDLDGIQPRVEAALRELRKSGFKRPGRKPKPGRAGKTLQNYAETIRAFCRWAKQRGLLALDPVESLAGFDCTPLTIRRAMTAEEVKKLLDACPADRRLAYEVALVTGLRRGELRELKAKHLDAKNGGLRLDAAWTKSRKEGFQPLPGWLTAKLTDSLKNKGPESEMLPGLPWDAALAFERDCTRAGVLKMAPGGKVDFHALRVAFVTFVMESGANVKEAQSLARHSTPALTVGIYAKARPERLAKVTEAVGRIVESEAPRAVALEATNNAPVCEESPQKSIPGADGRKGRAQATSTKRIQTSSKARNEVAAGEGFEPPRPLRA